MCTAAAYTGKDHYFGRNLDLEFSYHETVTVTPRNKALTFRHCTPMPHHFALIGMAYVVGDYPLYYDAVNEKGLGMAGLNFPGNADYGKAAEGKDNITSFEFIPWILGQCESVQQARALLAKINLTDDAFAPQLPPSPLHRMIADQKEAVVFEQTAKGGVVYDNPVGVMTNVRLSDDASCGLYERFRGTSAAETDSGGYAGYVQPRHGRLRNSGRSFFGIPFCESCIHADEFGESGDGVREHQSVFQDSRVCRAAERLLPAWDGCGRPPGLRVYDLQLLLQSGQGNLLLHDL